jgi:hypothetical protein
MALGVRTWRGKRCGAGKQSQAIVTRAGDDHAATIAHSDRGSQCATGDYL